MALQSISREPDDVPDPQACMPQQENHSQQPLMAHVLLTFACGHTFDCTDEVRQILVRDWVRRRVVCFRRLQSSGRIRFNPTLRQNLSEKRLHTFQPLEARDRRTRPGLPKSTGLIDAELRDVDDALLHAKLNQEVRKLAVLFESARRQLASL